MELSPAQRALSLAAVISTSFGVGLSFGIGFPLTALTFEAWQQPKWLIGLAGAAPAIALLLALPVLPRIVTSLGTVPAIVWGCVLGGLGFLGLYFCSSPWTWILVRIAMSAGFAMPWLAGETWINSVAPETARGRVIAFYAIAYFSGYAVGPITLQALGTTELTPFLVSTLLTASSCLPILAGRKLAPRYQHDRTKNFVSSMRLAPVAMISAFIGGFAEIINLSLIPNVALAGGQTQEEALWLLSVLTLGGIVLQFPIGWLSDKTSRFKLMIGLALAFIGLALVLPVCLASPLLSSVIVFLIGGVILGFYSLGLALLGERLVASELVAANAAFIVMYQVGALFGPLFAGIAMTVEPVKGFVWTGVSMMLASIVAALALHRAGSKGA